MAREKQGASRRSSPGDSGTAATRPDLKLIRPTRQHPAPNRGMWRYEPAADATTFTTLADWPSDSDFRPLIEAAVAAGNHILAAQLEGDRAFCAAARAQLSRSVPRSEGSSA